MATVQQSIEIKVPVQVLYNQLTQFEDYPEFMDDVKAVKQIDDTHMHWTTMMANRPVEWDAEITEQDPDRCIAWHNVSGPTNGGRIDVQAIGADASCVTFTLQSLPEQAPGSMAGESEDEMAQRLKFDLVRLKDFLESRRDATGAWRGEIQDAKVTLRDRDARAQEGAQPQQAAGQGQKQGQDRVAELGVAQGTGQSAGQQKDRVAPLGTEQGTGRSSAQAGGQEGDAQAGRGSPRNSPVPTSSYAAGSEGFAGDEEPSAPVASSAQTFAQQRNDSAGSALPGHTAASAGVPDRSQSPGAGGTDAAAGARMAGKPATQASGLPGGAATAGSTDTTGSLAGGAGPGAAAGATAAGRTGPGGADIGADAGDTRAVPREGTSGPAETGGAKTR